MPTTAEPPKSNTPQLLKVEEVAKLLRVRPKTIYDMVAEDRIPFRKPAGSKILRFDLDEIVEWTRGQNNSGQSKNDF
jgi:excisionase family DNA binding protein